VSATSPPFVAERFVSGSDISARVEAMRTIAPLCGAQPLLGGARQQNRCGQISVEDALPFGERQPAKRLADH